ncbi:protein of unknown function [Lentzea xinjiangensis]|uniref:DUF397 domain-containing protein n=1 Tax=Lentzea xinjiangensis TaxID=402600 RepID=A0A1H9TCY9_9PSEU|nr:protein of unknown function [Lentzea xinjiangensis]
MGNRHAPAWGERRVSSYSDGANNCLEVAHCRRKVGLWDTKDRGLGHLEFTLEQWQWFVDTAKRS